jgi:hypothetical protein
MSDDDYKRRPLGYESSTHPAPPPVPPSLPGTPLRPRWQLGALPFGLIRIVWTFTAVLLAVVLVIVPMVETTFRSNQVDLPASSAALFAISSFLRRTYLWVLPAILGAALPFLIAAWAAKAGDDDDRRTRIRLASGLLLLVGIGLTVWVVLGLFLPYTGMLENLTSGR